MATQEDATLANQHWIFEDYRQRMTTKQWKKLLLNGADRIVFRGRMCRLKAKSLGAGVVEVYKDSLAMG